MAKKEKVAETTESTEGASGKGRKVLLTDKSSGEQTPRADYIKSRFAAGVSRSDIVKELKEKFDHTVPYQIVFAATKTPKAANTESAPATEGQTAAAE